MKDLLVRKIYYHHTDAGGVVYYGRYLNFLEEGRAELMAARGVCARRLAAEGILFAVARQEIDYLRPARYGEEIKIHTTVSETGGAKVVFCCEIKGQDGAVICRGSTVMVCVDGNFKARRLPPEVKRKLG